MKKTIGIVDDHHIFREGLVSLLKYRSNAYAILEYNDGLTLLESNYFNTLDILILDISLPTISGLDILQILRKKGFKKPIIMLSMFQEKEYGLQALEFGASAYLSKSVVSSELISCIETVEKGELFISNELSQLLAKNYQGGHSRPSYASLSNREQEVLKLLGQGYKSVDISKMLFISIKTVSTYKTRVFEKLNISSLTELILYCIKYGLVKYT